VNLLEVAYHALPRFRSVVFRRPVVALAWPVELWVLFASLEFLAGLLFALLMLEVLWR